MLFTPVYLDLGETIPLNIPNIDVPQNEEELALLEKPLLGNKFYYLVIHPPKINNSINSIPLSSTKINISSHASLNNKLRLLLLPTIGHGINSCYRVEYYSWTKIYIPPHLELTAKYKDNHKKIYEEYWAVPTIDRFKILNYLSFIKYIPRYLHTASIKLVRGSGNTDSLINYPEVISIKHIEDYTDYQLVDNSIPYHFTDPPTTPSITIDWSNSNNKPTTGSEYEITYIKPFSRQELIWRLTQFDKNIVSRNSYVYPDIKPFDFPAYYSPYPTIDINAPYF